MNRELSIDPDRLEQITPTTIEAIVSYANFFVLIGAVDCAPALDLRDFARLILHGPSTPVQKAGAQQIIDILSSDADYPGEEVPTLDDEVLERVNICPND